MGSGYVHFSIRLIQQSEGECTLPTYVLPRYKVSNKTNLQKHAVRGIVFLHDLIDPSDKGQHNESELREGIPSEKLERAL